MASVNSTSNNGQIQQTQIDSGATVDGGDKVNKTSSGVGGGENLTVEKGQSQGDPQGVANGHDIDQPPAPGADPNMETPMQNMDDSSWDETCDVYALIHTALQENAKAQNEMQKESNDMETENLEQYMDSQDKLADDTKTLAMNQGTAQMVSGVTTAVGGVAAGATAGSPALSGAINSGTGGLAGTATGIEGMADAGLQGDIKLDEKECTIAQNAQQKSADLRQSHGKSFDKTEEAMSETKRQQGDLYNAQAQAMRGS